MAEQSPTPGNPFEVRAEKVKNLDRKVAYYNGSVVNLAGIYANTAKLEGNFANILDVLYKRQNNFFRQYLTPYFLYQVTSAPTDGSPDPRQKYSPFLWLPKDTDHPARSEKWDLTNFNDDYFTRLNRMLARAQERGIVVQLTIFDAAGMRFKDRWPYHPWNAKNNVNGVVDSQLSAMPAFYNQRGAGAVDGSGNPTTLGAIQDGFVRKVVSETLDYWNVVFEIMNEPSGGQPAARAGWADIIVGVINSITRGRRLIFYNDHSQAAGYPAGGEDVNQWKALPQPNNYDALDGVIIHGDPNKVMDSAETAWTFTADKLMQASSDTFTDPVNDGGPMLRDTAQWNADTATELFKRRVIFQAESIDTRAADGIKSAKPTVITRAPFLGDWNKTSTDTPPFNIHFDSNGRYFAFNQPDDTVIAQGRLSSFSATQFVVRPDGQAEVTYNYTLSADGMTFTITAVANGRTQTFRRFFGDIEAFLYGWKKFDEDVPTGPHVYLLFFHQDGSFAARDVNSRQPLNTGNVVSISADQSKITLHSATTGTQIDYTYFFHDNGRRLRLTRLDTKHWQEFARTFEGVPA